MSDLPLLSMNQNVEKKDVISMDQFRLLCRNYLPYLYSKEIHFENSIQKRGELIYQILKYFTLQPSEKSYQIPIEKETIAKEIESWKFVQLSQVFFFSIEIQVSNRHQKKFSVFSCFGSQVGKIFECEERNRKLEEERNWISFL
jgi:hypothetical protein